MQKYVDKIFSEHEVNELSYFELNLETWRQLWRVLEKSDILLIIVDIRYPVSIVSIISIDCHSSMRYLADNVNI